MSDRHETFYVKRRRFLRRQVLDMARTDGVTIREYSEAVGVGRQRAWELIKVFEADGLIHWTGETRLLTPKGRPSYIYRAS